LASESLLEKNSETESCIYPLCSARVYDPAEQSMPADIISGMKVRFWTFTLLLLTACTAQPLTATPTLRNVSVFIPLPTETVTLTPLASPVPTATIIPTAALTLAPYEQYSIDYLRARSYGGGTLDVAEKLVEHEKYTTYTVRYQSDGLYIYAIMNIPNGDAIYPVIISIHGYIEPQEYYILDTDFTIEDVLASEGYITIHPTLRNYPPSENGDNLYRVGHSIDILNLIAIVKGQAGSGILEKADSTRIGLGGRSMGGGIALRVLTVTPDVKAAYLYSPISGDESRNAGFFHNYTRDPQFKNELDAPADVFHKISPQNYYSNISAAVLLAHGNSDRLIPGIWSEDTCNLLKQAGVEKRCLFYKGADHSFHADDLTDFISEILAYFEVHLRQ
jgi:dienelactone hydrolase